MKHRPLKTLVLWAWIALWVLVIMAGMNGRFMVAAAMMYVTLVPHVTFLYLHYAPERERMRQRRAEWRRQKEAGLTDLTEQQACDSFPSICTL